MEYALHGTGSCFSYQTQACVRAKWEEFSHSGGLIQSLNSNISLKAPPPPKKTRYRIMQVRTTRILFYELVIQKSFRLGWGHLIYCKVTLTEKQVAYKWFACIQSQFGTNYIQVAVLPSLFLSHLSGFGGPTQPHKPPGPRRSAQDKAQEFKWARN